MERPRLLARLEGSRAVDLRPPRGPAARTCGKPWTPRHPRRCGALFPARPATRGGWRAWALARFATCAEVADCERLWSLDEIREIVDGQTANPASPTHWLPTRFVTEVPDDRWLDLAAAAVADCAPADLTVEPVRTRRGEKLALIEKQSRR